MRALRVRLVGLGASLTLVLTGIGGVGSALANDEVNLAAACFNVAAYGGANAQSVNVAQGNATVAATGGTNIACIAVSPFEPGERSGTTIEANSLGDRVVIGD